MPDAVKTSATRENAASFYQSLQSGASVCVSRELFRRKSGVVVESATVVVQSQRRGNFVLTMNKTEAKAMLAMLSRVVDGMADRHTNVGRPIDERQAKPPARISGNEVDPFAGRAQMMAEASGGQSNA